ncbi:MAG: hypothetical protein NDI69_13365 [Bacteriovoracaceae bacterium]|nr:hypothetical protein [Bacteriovoracaceae bacterium]
MKQRLNYGRITWSYDDDLDSKVTGSPTPLLQFTAIRIQGKFKVPQFSDRVTLLLLKHKTKIKISFREAYLRWYLEESHSDRDLGEGKAFLLWLKKTNQSIAWKKTDYKLHRFFTDDNAPKHDPEDEMAEELSFAVRPVEVEGRKVKLYLQDDAVLNLINLSYGEESDFLGLVKNYVALRFKWESWRAPAPPFLDWVKSQAKRPVFLPGQLGFSLLTETT